MNKILSLLCFLHYLDQKNHQNHYLPQLMNKQTHPVPKEAMMLDQDKDKIKPLKQILPSFYSKSITHLAQKQPFSPRKNSLQMSLPGTVGYQSKNKTHNLRRS